MKTYAFHALPWFSDETISLGFEPRRIAAELIAKVKLFAMREHGRRQLAELDAHLLEDIGVDPIDAAIEASKPFWKP